MTPFLLLGACTPATEPAGPPTPELLSGPVITHVPPAGALSEGDLLTLEATATDEDGIDGMELRVRPSGELFYERVEMERRPGAAEDSATYTATVTVTSPGVEYLFRAFDDSDFRIPGTFPLEAEADPVVLPVADVPLPAPYSQGFDAEVDFGLFDFGWSEDALAFRGRRWRHTSFDFHGGNAARHSEGFVGMDPVDDWLISPTLDFSALPTAEVRWMEYGAGVDRADHELQISTGSRDPESGDFVKVTGLTPPPEGRWGPAPVIDLSAWAGEPRVTLAWRYRGEGPSDLWVVDEIRVREFAPDLLLMEATPGRADPGMTTTVAVRLRNQGAPTFGPVTLSGAVLEGEGSWLHTVDLGPLDTNQVVDAVLELQVEPDQPDNTLLQAELSATDGTDVFTWPLALQVGDPTAGLVRLQVIDPGLVQVWVGVGDPAAPVLEEVVHQGQLAPGVYTFAADLGEHVSWLPSTAGRDRWWAKVRSESDSYLLGFGIDFDGEVSWSSDVGATPGSADGVFYLPARARPVVTALVPDPAPLAPGAPGSLQLTLTNRGGPTVGYTEARLSADAALGLQTSVVPLPADWTGSVTLDLPVQVDPAHTDSVPLAMQIDLVDSGESYSVDVSIPVPWPRLSFGAPQVTDPDGNDDGVLDPGENVGVVFSVDNTGALGTGALTCTVTQESGPSVGFTGSIDLPALAPGDSRALNLIVSAGSVNDGDTLAFAVSCTDGVGTHTGSFSLSVGGLPWIPVGMDPLGDALVGASFDIRQGRFRVDGPLLELELIGVDPIDAATLHLDLWTDSPGSAWRNVVVTVVDGEGTLWGVQSGGWSPLPDPTVLVTGNTVKLGLPIGGMGLAENTLQVAVGTGLCGIPELYCDHWPDGWGNPYASGPSSTHWVQFGW